MGRVLLQRRDGVGVGFGVGDSWAGGVARVVDVDGGWGEAVVGVFDA